MMENSLQNAPLYERIYAVVRQIPPGQVATYGQIARIVGGCSAQMIGFALAALPATEAEHEVPWQRVLNRLGQVSPRDGGGGSARQRQLLEAEGVQFDTEQQVDLEKIRWPGPDWDWAEKHGFAPQR